MEVKLKTGAKLVFVPSSDNLETQRVEFGLLTRRLEGIINKAQNDREFKVRLFGELRSHFNNPEFIDSDFFNLLASIVKETTESKEDEKFRRVRSTKAADTVNNLYVGLLDREKNNFTIKVFDEIVLDNDHSFYLILDEIKPAKKIKIQINNKAGLAKKLLVVKIPGYKLYFTTNESLINDVKDGKSK